MEVGKFYKGEYNGVVVKCTTKDNYNRFGGFVVQADTGYFLGYACDSWLCEAFKEYTPAQTNVSTNGRVYDIPRGCKATVKNGQVLIESGVRYYKHEFESFVRYGKHVEGGRTTIITLCCNGDTKIFHIGERPCPDISGCVKEIDEIEFTNAYNTALKNLEL